MKSRNTILTVTLTIATSLTNLVWSQGLTEKKTQAGISTTFGLNMLRMGTAKMNSDGVGSNIGIGVMIHSSLKNSKNLGLSYGLEFEFGSFRFSPAENTYYNYNDKEILTRDESNGTSFQLMERKQKPIYVTLPLMFLFRTDFIGDFRYFGKFGVRNSFLVSNKMNDTGIDLANGSSDVVDFSNMRASGETFFYNGSVGLTAGAEWNFIGSTVLVGELGYFYGITPLFLDRKSSNKSLYTIDNSDPLLPKSDYFSNNASLSQILLKVSILF